MRVSEVCLLYFGLFRVSLSTTILSATPLLIVHGPCPLIGHLNTPPQSGDIPSSNVSFRLCFYNGFSIYFCSQFSLDFYVELRSKRGAFALSQRCLYWPQRFWFVALTATIVSTRAARIISAQIYFYFIFGLSVQVSYESAFYSGTFSRW